MRVPVGQIYRAFPELDRFTDDQCRAFVRAACRRGWRRHAHRLLIVVTTIASMVLLVLAFSALTNQADRVFRGGFERSIWFVPYVILGLAAVCSPLVLALILKDRLLLRRLRLVIRARGTCPVCRYTLLGVTVADDNTVLCPECGMTLEADPTLNEVLLDDQGRRSFMPSGRHKSLDFWTPRRRRIAKRLAVAAAIGVFVVLPVSWGGYEIFLRKQARTAAAERPGAAGLLAFVEASQPAGTSEDENGWDKLEAIALAISDVEADVINTMSTGVPKGPDFAAYSNIFDNVEDGLEGRGLEAARRNRQAALNSLARLREDGLLDQLDALADYRRAVHNFAFPNSQSAFMIMLPTLGDARNLARLNVARMHLAAENQDREEYLAALESALAIARFCYHQPTLIESLVGDAITALVHKHVQARLLQHPDTAWLDGIEAALARQSPTVDPSHRYRGELLLSLDAIAWFFQSPSHTRFGRFSPHINNIAGGGASLTPLDGRLGTYTENRDTYAAIMRYYIDNAGIDPVSRPPRPPIDTNELLLLEIITPALGKPQQTASRLDATTRATITMIALERYHIKKQHYPDTLDALTPTYLSVLPLDPWTGQSLVYQPRGADAAHYVLFSTGPDAFPDTTASPPVRQTRNDDIPFSPPPK